MLSPGGWAYEKQCIPRPCDWRSDDLSANQNGTGLETKLEDYALNHCPGPTWTERIPPVYSDVYEDVQIYEQTIPARGCSVDLDAAGRPSPSVPLVLSLDPARITSSKITTQIIAFFFTLHEEESRPACRQAAVFVLLEGTECTCYSGKKDNALMGDIFMN